MAWEFLGDYYNSNTPKIKYAVFHDKYRDGKNVFIRFRIEATMTTTGGFIRNLGPIVFRAGWYANTEYTSVVIKNQFNDNWSQSSGATRVRETGWMSITSTAKPIQVHFSVTSGNFTNGGFGNIAYNIYFPDFATPTAPSWVNLSPNPCEINTRYTISWGGATGGSLGITGYDVEVQGKSASGKETSWLRISNNLNATQYNETTPKNMNVDGVVGDKGVSYRYRIRTVVNNGEYLSPWGTSGWLTISFNPPTAPTNLAWENKNNVCKKNKPVIINWQSGSGGSGSVAGFPCGLSISNNNGSTWSGWSELFASSNKFSFIPVEQFPAIKNNDLIKFRVATKNNYNDISEYVISPNLTVKSSQIWVYYGGAWKEATLFLFTNGAWKESVMYIYHNNAWKETT